MLLQFSLIFERVMFTLVSYPIVGLMLGSKLSSTNLHTILDLPTPVS